MTILLSRIVPRVQLVFVLHLRLAIGPAPRRGASSGPLHDIRAIRTANRPYALTHTEVSPELTGIPIDSAVPTLPPPRGLKGNRPARRRAASVSR